mgnify:CR=1 FL=1
MSDVIKHFRDLKVYQNARKAAMEIYELTKKFPKEEKYSLVDQIRRSSRSVCSNISEAWHKRRYKAAFVAKLSDSEGEAAETQVWLDFSLECNYIEQDLFDRLDDEYAKIIGQLIRMINDPGKWTFKR